jgi:hypothetical protein
MVGGLINDKLKGNEEKQPWLVSKYSVVTGVEGLG